MNLNPNPNPNFRWQHPLSGWARLGLAETARLPGPTATVRYLEQPPLGP